MIRISFVFVLLSSSVAGAQMRYAGEGNLGFVSVGTQAFNGGPPGGFTVRFRPTWYVELATDDSQNATFHEYSLRFEAVEVTPEGRDDVGFRDLTMALDVDASELDMNPSGPAPGVFSIKPFSANSISIAGTYFNRSFESSFESNFSADSSTRRFNVDLTAEPDSIDLIDQVSGASVYRSRDIIEVEPFLSLTDPVVTITPFETMTLHPTAENIKAAAPARLIAGDSNVDGIFNSSDFVAVFRVGEYEDGIPANSTWRDGDWNGDQEFDTSDFVFAFRKGTYSATAVPVPEPSGVVAVLVGIVFSRFTNSFRKSRVVV